MKTITLLNTTIATTDGLFKVETISTQQALEIVFVSDIESAIGHESTAQILTEILHIPVDVNRVNYHQGAGDVALVFKLKGRPPEGAILSRDEIEKIGYEFKLMTRFE